MLLIVCRFKVVNSGNLAGMTTKNKRESARLRLARNIRAFRHSLGISQEELAELSGLHRTYVGSIERGERNISIDNIERLARALQLDVLDILAKHS